MNMSVNDAMAALSIAVIFGNVIGTAILIAVEAWTRRRRK